MPRKNKNILTFLSYFWLLCFFSGSFLLKGSSAETGGGSAAEIGGGSSAETGGGGSAAETGGGGSATETGGESAAESLKKKFKTIKQGGMEVPPHLFEPKLWLSNEYFLSPEAWLPGETPQDGSIEWKELIEIPQPLSTTEEDIIIDFWNEALEKEDNFEDAEALLKLIEWEEHFKGETLKVAKATALNLFERYYNYPGRPGWKAQEIEEFSFEDIPEGFKDEIYLIQESMLKLLVKIDPERSLSGSQVSSLLNPKDIRNFDFFYDLIEMLEKELRILTEKNEASSKPKLSELETVLNQKNTLLQGISSNKKAKHRRRRGREAEETIEKKLEHLPVLTDEMLKKFKKVRAYPISLEGRPKKKTTQRKGRRHGGSRNPTLETGGSPDILYPLFINKKIQINWIDSKLGLGAKKSLTNEKQYKKLLNQIIRYGNTYGDGAIIFPHYPLCSDLLKDVYERLAELGRPDVRIHIFVLPIAETET